MSYEHFRKLRIKLEQEHCFPKQHPVLGGYDLKAIDKWMDQTGGIDNPMQSFEAELIERAMHG